MAVRGKPWPKGTSGNPRGRLKAADLGLTSKQLMLKARDAGARCIEVLIHEMENAPRASERLTACGMLLDRGYGKAITAPDIAQIRADIRKNLEAIVLGHPRANELLADLQRRLNALDALDSHRMIDAVAAPAAEQAMPFLTVYSGKSEVDVLAAAPEVVAAIPGMTPDLLKSLAEARRTGADQQSVTRLLGALPTQMQNVVSIDGGDTYRVQVRIRYDNGRQSAAEVVIRTGAGDRAYGVLSWRVGFDVLSDLGPQPKLVPR
jgi:type II secretory pathway component PulK